MNKEEKIQEEFRKDVLANPKEYPNLHRIEVAKNKLRFDNEMQKAEE